jgi:hypothetical protein
VNCTYWRTSLVSKVLKKTFKSIIVSSSLALALEEKGTKTHFLNRKSASHIDINRDSTHGSIPLSGSSAQLDASLEAGLTHWILDFITAPTASSAASPISDIFLAGTSTLDKAQLIQRSLMIKQNKSRIPFFDGSLDASSGSCGFLRWLSAAVMNQIKDVLNNKQIRYTQAFASLWRVIKGSQDAQTRKMISLGGNTSAVYL